MILEYRLTLKDYLTADRDSLKYQILPSILIYAGFLGLVNFTPLFLKKTLSIDKVLFTVLGTLLMVAVVALAVYLIRYLTIKQSYQKILSLQSETNIETSDEGLKITKPESESKIKWILYTHWREDPTLFLIYASRRSSTIIPKRAFIDDRQIDEFRDLLNSKLPQK